jgi:hypothetical protein
MHLALTCFFWNNESYLLVSGYYSKFPLIRKLRNIQSNTVIAYLKSIFEEHGIPSKFVTGNDTQFTSSGFTEFSKTYGFEHVTTSPYYSQANRFIERNVRKFNRLSCIINLAKQFNFYIGRKSCYLASL